MQPCTTFTVFPSISVFASIWSGWSTWSFCNQGREIRVRACNTLAGFRCQGSNLDTRACFSDSNDENVRALFFSRAPPRPPPLDPLQPQQPSNHPFLDPSQMVRIVSRVGSQEPLMPLPSGWISRPPKQVDVVVATTVRPPDPNRKSDSVEQTHLLELSPNKHIRVHFAPQLLPPSQYPSQPIGPSGFGPDATGSVPQTQVVIPPDDSAWWSRWAEWTECKCSMRSRTRSCDVSNVHLSAGCPGSSYQLLPCVGGTSTNCPPPKPVQPAPCALPGGCGDDGQQSGGYGSGGSQVNQAYGTNSGYGGQSGGSLSVFPAPTLNTGRSGCSSPTGCSGGQQSSYGSAPNPIIGCNSPSGCNKPAQSYNSAPVQPVQASPYGQPGPAPATGYGSGSQKSKITVFHPPTFNQGGCTSAGCGSGSSSGYGSQPGTSTGLGCGPSGCGQEPTQSNGAVGCTGGQCQSGATNSGGYGLVIPQNFQPPTASAGGSVGSGYGSQSSQQSSCGPSGCGQAPTRGNHATGCTGGSCQSGASSGGYGSQNLPVFPPPTSSSSASGCSGGSCGSSSSSYGSQPAQQIGCGPTGCGQAPTQSSGGATSCSGGSCSSSSSNYGSQPVQQFGCGPSGCGQAPTRGNQATGCTGGSCQSGANSGGYGSQNLPVFPPPTSSSSASGCSGGSCGSPSSSYGSQPAQQFGCGPSGCGQSPTQSSGSATGCSGSSCGSPSSGFGPQIPQSFQPPTVSDCGPRGCGSSSGCGPSGCGGGGSGYGAPPQPYGQVQPVTPPQFNVWIDAVWQPTAIYKQPDQQQGYGGGGGGGFGSGSIATTVATTTESGEEDETTTAAGSVATGPLGPPPPDSETTGPDATVPTPATDGTDTVPADNSSTVETLPTVPPLPQDTTLEVTTLASIVPTNRKKQLKQLVKKHN